MFRGGPTGSEADDEGQRSATSERPAAGRQLVFDLN